MLVQVSWGKNMTLDSEEQRTVILQAILSTKIEGDLQGILEAMPKLTEVLDAVKAATVAAQDE
jgi:hypothetical protein